MRCDEIRAHFEDYRGGELSEELAAEVAQELERCPQCREAWEWFVATGEATRRWAMARAEELPEGSIWEAIAGELDSPSVPHRDTAVSAEVRQGGAGEAKGWVERLRAWLEQVRWVWAGAGLAAAAAAAAVVWFVASGPDTQRSLPGTGVGSGRGMNVASNAPFVDNEAEVLELEVRSGVVWIDQPDDPTQPLIVGVIEEGESADVPTGG